MINNINLINYLIISESIIFSLCFWSMYFISKTEDKKSQQLLSFKLYMIMLTIITSVNILGGLYLKII